MVAQHEALEDLGQTAVLADVVLQAFDAVVADDEPQFQRTEAAAQRNTPVLFAALNLGQNCSDRFSLASFIPTRVPFLTYGIYPAKLLETPLST